MNQYVCIKIDVVESRKIDYQAWLKDLTKMLREEVEDFVIDPTRRAGDEIFMVLSSMRDAWRCLRVLLRALHETEHEVYVGLGRGEISGAHEGSEGVEGSAVWRASDALLGLKEDAKSELLDVISKGPLRYNIMVDDEAGVNAYHLQNLFAILSRMLERTTLQQRASDLKYFYPDQNNTWFAEKLFSGAGGKHAETNFSKHLSRANHKLLTEMEETFIGYFDQGSES